MNGTTSSFDRARENYLAVRYVRPNWPTAVRGFLGACFGRRWWKLWLMFSILALTLAGCMRLASGAEGWTTAEVTAYCPCALCCGTHDRITASNTSTDAVPYAFAADRSLPFGTRVWVPVGLGVLDRIRSDDRWFQVDDRGGALDTEARRYGVLRLDLRVRDHWWAVRFGRRSLPVFISTTN